MFSFLFTNWTVSQSLRNKFSYNFFRSFCFSFLTLLFLLPQWSCSPLLIFVFSGLWGLWEDSKRYEAQVCNVTFFKTFECAFSQTFGSNISFRDQLCKTFSMVVEVPNIHSVQKYGSRFTFSRIQTEYTLFCIHSQSQCREWKDYDFFSINAYCAGFNEGINQRHCDVCRQQILLYLMCIMQMVMTDHIERVLPYITGMWQIFYAPLSGRIYFLVSADNCHN